MQPQRIIPVECPNCAHHFEVDTFAHRFWALVDRSAGPDGCWPWLGSIARNGYGWITISGEGPRRSFGAHRIAYELVNGPIADGLHMCHRCDFRRCCNPGHLFPGTAAENMADMVAKGRAARKGKFQEMCKNGHPLTPENRVSSGSGRSTRCRPCVNEKSRQWRANLSPDQLEEVRTRVRATGRRWFAAHPGYIQPSRRKPSLS